VRDVRLARGPPGGGSGAWPARNQTRATIVAIAASTLSECRTSFEAAIAIARIRTRTGVQVIPPGVAATGFGPSVRLRSWRPSSFDFQDAKIRQSGPRKIGVFLHAGLVPGCDSLKSRPKGGFSLFHVIPKFLALEASRRGLSKIAPCRPEPVLQRLYILIQSVGHGPIFQGTAAATYAIRYRIGGFSCPRLQVRPRVPGSQASGFDCDAAGLAWNCARRQRGSKKAAEAVPTAIAACQKAGQAKIRYGPFLIFQPLSA
jgi:hypothetical protein